MLNTNARRMMAAGLVAGSLLIAAQPAQASICIQCDPGSGYTIPSPKKPPIIGTASAGEPGGVITATATWNPPSPDPTNTATITSYTVRANRMVREPRIDPVTGFVHWIWVMADFTTSDQQPATARSLSLTLPQAGTYTFQVLAINSVGSSPYSAASNSVLGQ